MFDDSVEGGSWEDTAAVEEMWDTDATLRDARQAERARRLAEHQRIKLEKESKRMKGQKPNILATKLT